MNNQNSPADRLEGTVLASGWVVGKKIVKPAGASGGNFGICYPASRGQETAFVKALDFRRAFFEKDFLAHLNMLTSHVLWEKEIMEFCRNHQMSRVVRLLEYEDLILPEDAGDETKKVCCLVFEVGEGDLRAKFNLASNPNLSWRLRVLRDVALGLDQLHRRGIAHLDVKPSNVISVLDNDSSQTMKLADLARAIRKGVAGPFDRASWPGDVNYAPPEKWYGHNSSQWNDEREAADAYLLGNLFVYIMTGMPMNTLLYNEIPEGFKPASYRGKFDSQLIDVLRQAQSKALAIHVFPVIPKNDYKSEIEAMIVDLTIPDPEQRGDRAARRSGIVGMDRFHQRLHRISRRVALDEARSQR